jgi:hypothetical protein
MEEINFISGIATSLGVILILLQLGQTSKIEKTRFENEMVMRYIRIINLITFEIMYLDESEKYFDEEVKRKLDEFYKYFDLTNQELYLITNDEIRKKTAEEWIKGIKELMGLASFSKAWELIVKKTGEGSFSYFCKFLKTILENSSCEINYRDLIKKIRNKEE